MKKIEIVGYKRETLGTKSAKDLRNESLAPCVLYGGEKQVHFAVPMILFRELIYSPEVYEVTLNVEGDLYTAILQDATFHPTNEMILNVDFLEVIPGKDVKVEIPVKVTGVSPGVLKGGKAVQKLRKLKIKGPLASIPEFVNADITGLELGQTLKVSKLTVAGCEVLVNGSNPVVTIDIPRALRGKLTSGE
jgi:large subunit ribosomal protein L25